MKNMSLLTPDSAVAYLHNANLLEFTGINKKKEHTLLCEGDTIKNHSKNRFIFFPKKKGYHTLQLYKKKKLIDEFKIRTEILGRVKVYMGELRDSMVTAHDLVNNLYFNVTHFPQLKDPCTSVFTVDLIIKKANGQKIELGFRDSIQEIYYSNLSYLEDLKYEYIEEGKDVTYLEKYIDEAHESSYRDPLFDFYEMAIIASLEKGDMVFIPMVTLQCPSCIARKFGVNLKFIIIDE